MKNGPKLLILVLLASTGCLSPVSSSAEKSGRAEKVVPSELPTPTPTTIITCRDSKLEGIWIKILANDTVAELVNPEAGKDCSDYITVKKEVDLNNDGKEEVFVEGVGNFLAASTTPIWVVGRSDTGYTILLREQGEHYQIQKQRTNGYSDLYFPSRRSVWSATLSTYSFKDGKYLRVKCDVAFYSKSAKPLKTIDCGNTKAIENFESTFKFSQ